MLLPTAVIASSTWMNFSRLYQVMGYCHPHPILPRKRRREFEYGGNSWRWPVGECGKVRPFARPSGDLACGRHFFSLEQGRCVQFGVREEENGQCQKAP